MPRRATRLRLLLPLFLSLGAAIPAPASALPPIRHVFTIVLENENVDTSFGPASKAPYLAHTLTAVGEYLPQYFGIGHQSLDNYIAMVSGQGPNPVTQADCQLYTDVVPGTIGADGQAAGSGCVYPSNVQTVGNQLQAAGHSWRAYAEDMANSTTQAHDCRHPAANSQDSTQSAKAGDQYAARHEPFVYFHSVIDDFSSCADHVTDLTRLASDLRSAATTPEFAFVTPNLCHDGHDAPCVDGQPGGLVSADAFLAQWVPQILASPAYAEGGMVAIVFDESASGAEACCGEVSANTPNAGATSMGPGGGRVGAVILSQYVRPGTVNSTPYNHYSLLRTEEDLFGVGHLGYAGRSDLRPFGADVFNYSPVAAAAPTGPQGRLQPGGCTSTRVGASRVSRGSLLDTVAVTRYRGRSVLQLVTAHALRLHVTERSGRRTRRLRARRLRACRVYGIVLPRPHGRVTVTATVPHHPAERRVVRA